MIKRLMPYGDVGDWKLFGILKSRMSDFIDLYTPDAPKEAILYEFSTRWTTAPNLTGAFLGLDEIDHPYAHLAAWINTAYGRNTLFIYQAEAEKNLKNFDQLWPLVQEWISGLLKNLPPEQRRIKTEFTTWIEPEFWVRYFKKMGLDAIKVRHVLEADIFPVDFPLEEPKIKTSDDIPSLLK